MLLARLATAFFFLRHLLPLIPATFAAPVVLVKDATALEAERADGFEVWNATSVGEDQLVPNESDTLEAWLATQPVGAHWVRASRHDGHRAQHAHHDIIT